MSALQERERWQLAIIKDAQVRVEDHTGDLMVVFSAFVSEGVAASHWVGPREDSFQSLWKAMRGNVENLNGRACWVVSDGLGQRQTFLMVAEI